MWRGESRVAYACDLSERIINIAVPATCKLSPVVNWSSVNQYQLHSLYLFGCISIKLCGGANHVAPACDLSERNINIAIPATCILSSSVDKCTTICTPSIHLVVRHARTSNVEVQAWHTTK